MKEYVLVLNGIEHTVLMDEDEAKARGLKPAADASAKAAPAVSNKARTAPNK